MKKENKIDIYYYEFGYNQFLKNSLLSCSREKYVRHNCYFDKNEKSMFKFAIWQYTISGEGVLQLGSKVHRIKKGEGFLITTPADILYYLPEDSEGWEFLSLVFYGETWQDLIEEYIRLYGHIFAYEEDSSLIKTAYHIFNMAKTGILDSDFTRSMLSYDFIMQAFNLRNSNPKDRYQENIIKVKDFCIKNINKAITVNDMATIACCSKNHFSRIFAKHENLSPHQYLLHLRMEYARRLLQTTNYSNKEIALKCGYDNDKYFYSIFKKFFNRTPSQHRHKKEIKK